MIVWSSGSFVESGRITLAADDEGVLSGRGVFETLLIDRGLAVCRSRHIERLVRSAAIVGIEPRIAQVGAGIDAVLARWADPSPENRAPRPGRLRVTVTAAGAVLVTAAPLALAPATARVTVSPFVRNERSPLAGAKSTSYADNLAAHRHAQSLGYDEALLFNTRGLLSEGTRSNVFVAVDGRLATPPLSSGCLAGIVRALVIETGLAEQREVTAEDLHSTNEAFLTSSLRIAQPIARIGPREMPSTPGKLTEAVIGAVLARLAANADA